MPRSVEPPATTGVAAITRSGRVSPARRDAAELPEPREAVGSTAEILDEQRDES